jgi:hypothetical protein
MGESWFSGNLFLTQGSNPRTDFRGSGYISLLFITYFVKQYEKEYREIINLDHFMFAIVAIRLIVNNFVNLVFLQNKFKFSRR